MYQALYRKYRPSNFDEVVGQKVIVKTLKNAIKSNKLVHAYLFTGPRGTGKTSIAKILARTVNCTDLQGTNPCNKCENCLQNKGQSPDIIEIDAASNNGIDEIRELKSKVNLVPSYGRYKIYIIDEVHMLTVGAFNALLKTLEEPPAHIIFILATTDPHKVPITILSRCQRFDFKKISDIDIFNNLKNIIEKEKITVSDESVKEISKLSRGGMRDALSILDQVVAYADNEITINDVHEINGSLTNVEINNFMKNLLNNDINAIFESIDAYEQMGKDFVKLTEEIIIFLKGILLKNNAPNYYEQNGFKESTIDEMNLKNDSLLNYVKKLNNLVNDLKNSDNPKIIFEIGIIDMLNIETANDLVSQEEKFIPKKEIIKQVSTLVKEKINNEPQIANANLDNLKNIRVNNTLCKFNKKEFIDMKNKIKEVKSLLMDSNYSDYASIILDSELKAFGGTNMIFVCNNTRLVNDFNNKVITIDKMLEKLYGEKYLTIAVTNDEWDQIKKEFNGQNKTYKYIDEPKQLFENNLEIEEVAKNSDLENIFENIIEYEN